VKLNEKIEVQALGNIQSLLNFNENCPEYSFYKLFANCTPLTTAPALFATQIKPHCYEEMFNGCANINRLEVYFVRWDEESTKNWVKNISSHGTFIKPYALPIDS